MPTVTPDWITLIGSASTPAIFAVLFIWYFVQTRKDERENRLQDKLDVKEREVKDRAESKEREQWFREANVEHTKAMTEVAGELRAFRNEMAYRLDAIERVKGV